MVKQVKVLKHNWFKNNDANGGAQSQALKALPTEHIAVHSLTESYGRMWSAMTPEAYLLLLKKNYGLYEIITRFPHKVYFDIDKKGRDEDLLTQVTEELSLYFPGVEWAVSGSITDIKTSYHLVAQNYTIGSEEDRTAIQIVASLLRTTNEYYDNKVYTKNRLMKSIGQSKPDGRVQEIIENNDWRAHLITAFLPLHSLPFVFPEQVATEVKVAQSKSFDIKNLPTLAPIELTLSTDPKELTPLDLLSLLRIDKSCTYQYTNLVARFCFCHGITKEQYIAWIRPLHNDVVAIDRNWKTLPKYEPVHLPRIYKIIQHFYPSFGKDLQYKRFSDAFDLPPAVKVDTLSPVVFNGHDKWVILNTGMGSGKTAQTIDFLARGKNGPRAVGTGVISGIPFVRNGDSALWIAPNRALACNTLLRLKEEGIPFADYNAFKPSEKKEGVLQEQPNLLSVINSLHYIGDKTYEIVVIDEPETLWGKFQGPFMEKKKECWTAFLNVLTHAKKVILLDAFVTTATTNLIQAVERANKGLPREVIYEREIEPVTRTVKYIKTFGTMLVQIKQDLTDGKKVFIYYPYKTKSAKHDSMETIYNMLEAETGKKGIFYHADQSDTVKAGIKQVNDVWDKVSFVITNNVITCGVNYDQNDETSYDTAYLFIASFSLPRDIIQVSYRCRVLRSNMLKVCFMGRMVGPDTWEDDTQYIGCPIYKQLIGAVLTERQAPIRRAFQLFCVKARYAQKTDASEISEALQKEIDGLLQKHAIHVSYGAIDKIDYHTAEDISERLFKESATMEDKYKLQKYYFANKFDKDDYDMEHKEIGIMWNSNQLKFVEQIEKVLRNPDHVFHHIARELGVEMPNLFGMLKDKQQFSRETVSRIFKEFVFSHFEEHSKNHILILTNIYNTYFGKPIIESIHDRKTKHTVYELSDDYNYVVEFVRENHIRRKEWTEEKKEEAPYKEWKPTTMSFED